MTETPREYKKRIDEKWKRNEKNKEKLIQKIEGYELLDEGFKAKTKKEILKNFEKNQKAEQESEQYITIVSELGKIDQKYEELNQLKEKLEVSKTEKVEVEQKIRESKLDGTDETTLKLQMAGVKKLKERLKTLKSEIEELEKEVANREQEIKEVEETYGERIMSSGTENLPSSAGGKGSYTGNIQDSSLHSEGQESVQGKLSTLKEYQDQTIQELWNKDRVRGQIFKILEAGTGIDDELKEKIKKEISDRFFEEYHEKQGTLKMKSARYIKNKLKKMKRENEKEISESTEKVQRLDEIEKLEDIWGIHYIGKSELSEITGVKIEKNDMIMRVGGKPLYKAKDKNGKIYIIRGKELYGGGYDKILNVEDVGGEPVIKVSKKREKWLLVGKTEYKILKEFEHIGGKQLIVTEKDGKYCIIRGKEQQCGTLFTSLYGIKALKEIGGKLLLYIKDCYSFGEIYRGDDRCGKRYEDISNPIEIGGKPCFLAFHDYNRHIVRGYYEINKSRNINSLVDIGGKPCYRFYDWGVCWGDKICGRVYDKIKGEIKDVDGKPNFVGIKYGVEYEVLGYSEI